MSDSRVKRVLILDDEQGVLRTLVEHWRAPDLHIVTCSEVEAAECLMDQYSFDVLVADFQFSKFGGLDGVRLMRRIAVRFPKLEVIVFSGQLGQEVREIGVALGVTEMLEKPVDLNQLRDRVDSISPVPGDADAGVSGGVVTRASRLEEVIEDRDVSALLQPIVGLDDRASGSECFGFEGLARGPEGSALRSPEILLGYASRKELLVDTELLCIEAVLSEAKSLTAVGKLFINVRSSSLSTPGFAAALCDLVSKHGFQAGEIVLELSEHQSILNLEALDTALAGLLDKGFGLALDDFGRGFANLHLVERLPLEYLKIDGFFCEGIEKDQRKQSIVHWILEMARELGISTIMERVETESELAVVKSLGATYAQGYLFCRPAPGRDLSHWIGHGAAPSRDDFQSSVSQPVKGSREYVDHEVSNLLTAIALSSSQCMKRVENDHPLREELRQILLASEQAIALSER